jgi:hypothetical protein
MEIILILSIFKLLCRRLNRNKTGHDLAETLVATIDQISWDILLSCGHEIGYDMHQCVSLPILNLFNIYMNLDDFY